MQVDTRLNTITHHEFRNIDQLLTKNDVLVFNNTKVIRARLIGKTLVPLLSAYSQSHAEMMSGLPC